MRWADFQLIDAEEDDPANIDALSRVAGSLKAYFRSLFHMIYQKSK
jgi:hypothetical protein